MRLAAKRPQSTMGITASMTARTRPSAIVAVASGVGEDAGVRLACTLRLELATSFPTQHDGRKRRKIEIHRIDASVRSHRRRFDAAQISPAGAAVVGGVGVDYLAPNAPQRHAELKVRARYGRKIAHHEQWRALSGRLSQKCDDAHVGVADIHPIKAFGRKVHLVKRRLAPINSIQIADEALDARMTG